MYTTFKDKKIRRLCEDKSWSDRKLGKLCADKLFLRITQIRAADNLFILKMLPGRCHPLTGDRNGQYALDLIHPKRLILLPTLIFENGNIIEKLTTDVVVLEIVDYH